MASTLGPQIRVHRARGARVVVPLALVSAAQLAAVVALLTGRLGLLGYLMIIALTGLLVTVGVLPRLARVIATHQHGLRISGADGERTVPWEQIEAVYLEVAGPLAPRAARVTAGEREFGFSDDLDAFDELLGRLFEAVERNLPDPGAALAAGGSAWFGPLQATGRGLAAHGVELAWDEVEPVELVGRRLRFGDTLEVPLGLVANPHLLAALLRSRQIDCGRLETLVRYQRSDS